MSWWMKERSWGVGVMMKRRKVSWDSPYADHADLQPMRDRWARERRESLFPILAIGMERSL